MADQPPTPLPGAVSRADVARRAGVSSAVVSYVVNDGPRPVATATATRVREAIKALGYRPNASARALRSGSTRLLGLVVPEIANPLFAELALAVESAAAERGYAVLLANSEGEADSERRHIRNLVGRQVEGLLLTTMFSQPDRADLMLEGTPTVLLNTFVPVPGFAGVGVDAFAGAYRGTKHLIGHGHSSIALVIGGHNANSQELRERGWRQSIRDAGLPDGPIAQASWSRAGGYRAGLRLLDSSTIPTAVFVSSDLQAVGVLRAARELGVRVPQDLALVSFDGTEESDFTAPRLTVMRQPVGGIASGAVDRVLKIGHEPGVDDYTTYPAELIVRESCGCISDISSVSAAAGI